MLWNEFANGTMVLFSFFPLELKGPKRTKKQEKSGATEAVRKRQRVDDRLITARHRPLPDSGSYKCRTFL